MIHAKIFRDIFRSQKKTMSLPTQRELAERTGITEGYLSAFLLEQKDIKSAAFVKLISVMPENFKQEYFLALAEMLEVDTEVLQSQKKKIIEKTEIKI